MRECRAGEIIMSVLGFFWGIIQFFFSILWGGVIIAVGVASVLGVLLILSKIFDIKLSTKSIKWTSRLKTWWDSLPSYKNRGDRSKDEED